MQPWAKRIQRRTDINAKWIVWLGCIVSAAVVLLKATCCKSKSTEEVKPPKDYAEPAFTDSDWVNWITENKDNWN